MLLFLKIGYAVKARVRNVVIPEDWIYKQDSNP